MKLSNSKVIVTLILNKSYVQLRVKTNAQVFLLGACSTLHEDLGTGLVLHLAHFLMVQLADPMSYLDIVMMAFEDNVAQK